MSDNMQTISPDALRTEYVSPAQCEFFTGSSGFLGARINGTEYRRVILMRALPLTRPDEYICISDVEKNELGIIEKLSDFPPEQREMIESELSKRYFCPVITEIKSVREKFGNFYFDVMIGERKKNFTVKNITKNIRYHGSGFDIIDIDGNRDNIPDYSQISGKSRRNLDPYIY